MGKGTKRSSFLNYKNLFRLIFYCSLLIILTTCGGDVKVEESSTNELYATYENNQIYVKGATIIVNGTSYYETAPIQSNDLAAIILDSTLYFYHPILGSVKGKGVRP